MAPLGRRRLGLRTPRAPKDSKTILPTIRTYNAIESSVNATPKHLCYKCFNEYLTFMAKT